MGTEIDPDQDRRVPAFPNKTVYFVTAISVVIIAMLALVLVERFQDVRSAERSLVSFSSVRGDILKLDEVLTTSALLAVTTGELEWADRHDQAYAELEDIVASRSRFETLPEINKAIQDTLANNQKLVAIEREAISLVRAGQHELARNLLRAQGYMLQKQQYSREVETSFRAMEKQLVNLHRDLIEWFIIIAASMSFLLAIWWGTFFREQRIWRKALHTEIQRQKDEIINLRLSKEQELERERDNLRGILEAMEDGVYIVSADYTIDFVNQALEKQFGEVDGRKCYEYLYNSDKPCSWCKNAAVFSGQSIHWDRDINGRSFSFFDTAVHKPDGSLAKVKFFHDVTDERRNQETARKLMQAVEQSPVSVMITNTDGVLEYVNQKFQAVTGYHEDEILGKNPKILKSGYTSGKEYDELWRTISSGGNWTGEFCNRKKDGTTFWESAAISGIRDANGKLTHYLAVKEDITEKKLSEERLRRETHFDKLTGLPNRVLALDRLEKALIASQRHNSSLAALIIDLDDFKKVNDTLGHSVGDMLLLEASRRLTTVVRAEDTVARIGGDEFLVVQADSHTLQSTEVMARKVLEVFAEPFLIEDHELFVSASVGITLAPEDGSNVHVLMRNGDAALYQAKAAGRNAYRFFTAELNKRAVNRLQIESNLRQAVRRDGLDVFFQPLCSVETGEVISAEALVRWHDNDLGYVSPDMFIALAEETNLIDPIGEFVLRTACFEAVRWQKTFGREFHIAVNVSARQFRDGDFVGFVAKTLEETGLKATCLELEVTERLLLEDLDTIARLLGELSAMGIRLSIDDFGTGYSALSYLKKFPFSVLKIDRSFVRDVTTDAEDAALTTAIIGMAHGLGLEVIGEGVEEEEQLAFLREKGCDIFQGYLESPPLSAERFMTYLSKRYSTYAPGKKIG